MKKKVVIIGYGGQGSWHAAQIQKSDVAELLGIYDINPKRSDLAKEKGIFSYDTLDDAINDPASDIVVVVTPNDSHKEIVVKALAAGKNVICEKPAEMSLSALDEMIDASNRSGKLFTIHHNRRWDVDYLGMKQIIQSGKLGDVICVESRIHGSRGIPSDWRGMKEHGGGMLYDWGVHLIDQMLQLIPQKITSVFCTFSHITNKEVDDGFKLTINFESGAVGYVEVGTYNFIAMPRFYMLAKKGSAIITDWKEKAKVVYCKHWYEGDVLPVQAAAGITKTMAPRDEITVDTYEVERPVSDVHDFYRNFCAAIDGREKQIVLHSEIRRVMMVIEAAFKSVQSGNTVEFKDIL